MLDDKTKEIIESITKKYGIEGRMIFCDRTGNGNINDTYKVDFALDGGITNSYIYQKINTYVFTRPHIIMSNIAKVSDYIENNFGKDSEQSKVILCFENDLEGKNYIDGENGFWRVSKYIISNSYDSCDNAKILHDTGYAFGKFQDILSGMDANSLEETIPDFHNTKKRIEAFEEGVKLDAAGRCAQCEKEISFVLKYKKDFSRLVELHENGVLPYRVTHNDTKFNNILIDKVTGKPICVIDLDTIMPGLSGYDFGDAIRFAANYSVEDEPDLSKVGINLEFYEQFTKGFVGASKGFLTQAEKDSLALSAMTMTYELVARFLLDYLNGDKYFKIKSPDHNLVRTRCQMRLCESMMENYDKMCGIVDKYYN